MVRAILYFGLIAITSNALGEPPMPPDAAFSEGKTFSQGQLPAAKANIDPTKASSTVPNYTTTTPETGYFGLPGLGTPAGARVTTCKTSVLDPNNYNDQSCDATNFTQDNPTIRPTITIAPTDPVLVNSGPIQKNPIPLTGAIGGTYSGCTVVPKKTPDVFQNFICNEFLIRETKTCTKDLNIIVTENDSCVPGTYFVAPKVARTTVGGPDHMVGQVLCEPDRKDGRQTFAVYAYGARGECQGPIPFTIDMGGPKNPMPTLIGRLKPHWEGSCRQIEAWYRDAECVGDSCTITFDFTDFRFRFGVPTTYPHIDPSYYSYGACPVGQPGDAVLPTLLDRYSCYASAAATIVVEPSGARTPTCAPGFTLHRPSLTCYQLLGERPITAITRGWHLTVNYEKPGKRYTYTDAWDNKCTTFEARLP